MHTLRKETFANNIFAIYGLICKNLLRKNKMLLWKTLWMLWKTLRFSNKTYKNWTRFANICSAKQCFWVNESQKQVLRRFLSFLNRYSTAFKLNDLLTTFLFFRLFVNALMKGYSLYGRGGGEKSFKETKICGVIVSKWILFIWRFFLLSQKMNSVSSISFFFFKKVWKRSGI